MNNSAKAPYPNGEAPDPETTGQIMQFRVATTVSSPDTSVIPREPAADRQARSRAGGRNA